jgi:hypothetical protein
MRLGLALALSLLAARSQPEIDVKLLEDRVVVRAVHAPLADVLTRFAQATGADITYDPAPPRQLVTLTIEAKTAAEAVEKLLEGQGLNYVLRLDPSGRKVEMLVVVGGASPSSPAAAGRVQRPGSPPPAEEIEPEETEEPFAPGEDLEPSPAPAPPVEGATPSGGGAAFPGSPGLQPSSPETPGGVPPQPGQPQPPAPASYPGAGPPPPPVYPGPASYPPGGH